MKPPRERDWGAAFRALSRGQGRAAPTASFGGPTSPSVSDVQGKLNALGASPQLTVDGKMGPMTLQAIKDFQNAHGLTADGIPGPQTLGAMGFVGASGVAFSSATPLPAKSCRVADWMPSVTALRP